MFNFLYIKNSNLTLSKWSSKIQQLSTLYKDSIRRETAWQQKETDRKNWQRLTYYFGKLFSHGAVYWISLHICINCLTVLFLTYSIFPKNVKVCGKKIIFCFCFDSVFADSRRKVFPDLHVKFGDIDWLFYQLYQIFDCLSLDL